MYFGFLLPMLALGVPKKPTPGVDNSQRLYHFCSHNTFGRMIIRPYENVVII